LKIDDWARKPTAHQKTISPQLLSTISLPDST
jgi:hypothetical protein